MSYRNLQIWFTILCAGFVSQASAQLSGNYTIGGSGSRNYSTWESFAADFNRNGVSGPVVVEVQSSLTLASNIEFKQHASNKTTFTNSLTIKGNGFQVKSTLDSEMIYLNGVDFMYLKKLKLLNESKNTRSVGIRFTNGADSNVIDSCTILFSGITAHSAKDTGAYIAFARDGKNITAVGSVHNGKGNLIRGCTMSTSGTGALAPVIGILDQQGRTDYTKTVSGNIITGNKIRNFFSVGIWVRYVNSEWIDGNELSRLDASSSDAVDTMVSGVYVRFAQSSARAFKIDNNKVFSLPYPSASFTSMTYGINVFLGVDAALISGNSSVNASISGNVIEKNMIEGRIFGVFSQYGDRTVLNGNILRYNKSENGYSYGIYANFGSDCHLENNIVLKNEFGTNGTSGVGALIFAYSVKNGFWNRMNVFGNRVDSNTSLEQIFGISLFQGGNWVVRSNRVADNRSFGSWGLGTGLYLNTVGNVEVVGNIFAKNNGDGESYNLISVNYNAIGHLKISGNTIVSDDFGNSNTTSSCVYTDDDSQIDLIGNILEAKGDGAVYMAYLFSYGVAGKVASNSFKIGPSIAADIYALGTNYYTSFSTWVGDTYVDENNEIVENEFVNYNKGDYRSKQIKNQNNVEISNVVSDGKIDFLGKNRHKVYCDRGAFEDTFNLKLSVLNLPKSDTLCSGSVLAPEVEIFNAFVDTVEDFTLGFVLNGVANLERFKNKILPGKSSKVSFSKSLFINNTGLNALKIFVVTANDIEKDDTFSRAFVVLPSPGGSVISSVTQSGTGNQWKISGSKITTIRGINTQMDVTAPRGLNNGDYGSTKKWVASSQLYLRSGKAVAGSSLVVPNGSNNLQWKFNLSDSTLDDSILSWKLKITDLRNGCDTVFTLSVYVSPTPLIDFQLPLVGCSKDTLKFLNNTKSRSTNVYLEYQWIYDGIDTSTDVDGSFIFSNGGTKKITLNVVSMPDGYVFQKVKSFSVVESPTASFSRTNACEGKPIVFTNTSNLGVGGNSFWTFGAKKDTLINSVNFNYSFAKPGSYIVALTADYKGCKNTTSSKVTVFEQPTASFTITEGNCVGKEYFFNTTTKMNTSMFGVIWDFGEPNALSTVKNTKYVYNSGGTKTVKIVVNSEFGCKDSLTKQVQVKESPVVDFTTDRLCLRSRTLFQNTTPDVSGSTATYSWMLDGIKVSSKDTFSRGWVQTGKSKVVLNVTLSNGCNASLEKEIEILQEALVDFDFESVCSGDSILFKNKSENSTADSMKYSWDFGNGINSDLKDPRVQFTTDATRSYNVILTTSVAGGCSTQRSRFVEVYELPRTCDFVFTPDYSTYFYGAKLEPMDENQLAGGQTGVSYQWQLKGAGNKYSSGVNAAVVYELSSDGTFEVNLIAITDEHSCKCGTTKNIVLDRLSASDLNSMGIILYPNPSKTNIGIQSQETILNVKLVDVNGKVILEMNELNTNNILLNISDFSNGIYLAKIQTERGAETLQWVKN